MVEVGQLLSVEGDMMGMRQSKGLGEYNISLVTTPSIRKVLRDCVNIHRGYGEVDDKEPLWPAVNWPRAYVSDSDRPLHLVHANVQEENMYVPNFCQQQENILQQTTGAWRFLSMMQLEQTTLLLITIVIYIYLLYLYGSYSGRLGQIIANDLAKFSEFEHSFLLLHTSYFRM